MEPLKWGPGLRATPCVRLREAGVMEPLQVGGIGCNKIKASMVKEGWRNLPSCCPQLVSAPSVPPQPHLAHPGMPLLGSLHGSCAVPGPGGSKQLLAPAALGTTWLPPRGSSGHQPKPGRSLRCPWGGDGSQREAAWCLSQSQAAISLCL